MDITGSGKKKLKKGNFGDKLRKVEGGKAYIETTEDEHVRETEW